MEARREGQIKVNMRRADLIEGKPCDGHECPLAVALTRRAADVAAEVSGIEGSEIVDVYISVESPYLAILTPDDRPLFYELDLDYPAQKFVIEFDDPVTRRYATAGSYLMGFRLTDEGERV